ncbi:MAG: hypothetical protein EOO88_41435, partial [Pedobacter sp.]
MNKKRFNCLLALVLLATLVACSKKDPVEVPDVPGKEEEKPTTSPPGDVVGKITAGYQGWFAAIGDGSPINRFWHWSHIWEQLPSPT